MNNSLGAVVYMPIDAINDDNIDDFVAFSARQGGMNFALELMSNLH